MEAAFIVLFWAPLNAKFALKFELCVKPKKNSKKILQKSEWALERSSKKCFGFPYDLVVIGRV